MEYNFKEIEKKWQEYWKVNGTFVASNHSSKPKYYVLDMFPYPSGAGLHVGHPLGYIASDIYARYMRHRGYNVLHPMGYDAYGLPAEQYAIQTGTHPLLTTYKNIDRYRTQLDQIGFSFDWSREVRTCDPKYYKWTQWTFIQLFEHWYNNKSNKAEPIKELVKIFSNEGNASIDAACSETNVFSATEWNAMDEKEQQETLMNYRLVYLADTWVNWCPELGTVLANDEVKDGLSERGGHPVERKMMKQWSLRITAYAQRLLDGHKSIEWSESIVEIQKNWIGRSEGAAVKFDIKGHNKQLEVFTTRPDTLWGATFMVLAPEHEWVEEISTPEKKEEVVAYMEMAKNRSERDRAADVKRISGVFTGAYGINAVNGEEIPIWIADYVLMGYGTGAIMAVPAHDSRDFAFARHFKIPIIQVVSGAGEEMSDPMGWEESYDAKEGVMVNSGFITGMEVKDGIQAVIKKLQDDGIGEGKINFRLRDAIFSRQRYWGEPFPVYYKDGMPYMLDESELPLELPEVDKYLPTESGEPPLARAKDWVNKDGYPLETNTMPGFAGSSAYYYRYMDPHNDKEYFSKEANEYWQDVDLYIGGDEHATGHLLYARFWSMFLYDIGLACKAEPFRKLINQGKIQGRSNFVYRLKGENTFVSYNLIKDYDTMPIHVDISMVDDDILDTDAFKNWRPEFEDAEFILEDGKYICGFEIEKMSKSKHNVQNPDEPIGHYGADTLRMYEMFLGPLEYHKPWDTKGIGGVFRFLKKLWNLYHDQEGAF
jgi:leucyl-tRNA synthetase